jgi:hypothetical protein
MGSVTDVLAGGTDGGGYSFGPGTIGFVVLAGLALAIIVLYRSMRKNLRRIDFNPDGRTDAERMHGHDTRGNGGGLPDDVGDVNVRDRADDGNGHR